MDDKNFPTRRPAGANGGAPTTVKSPWQKKHVTLPSPLCRLQHQFWCDTEEARVPSRSGTQTPERYSSRSKRSQHTGGQRAEGWGLLLATIWMFLCYRYHEGILLQLKNFWLACDCWHVTVYIELSFTSKLEWIPGGGFGPIDKSITEYYRYLNTHKYYNPWFNWWALICRCIE